MKMKSPIKPIYCSTWEAVLKSVQQAKLRLDPDNSETIWFRGCTDSAHKLIPTLMRDTAGLSEEDHYQIEGDLFFEFQARATELRQKG